MRKLFIILLSVLSISLSANTYYVATPAAGGNDSNPGTLAQPWASWQKAFATAVAGDTVWYRGGVYYTTIKTGLGIPLTNDGTSNNLICHFAYPGEVPIMDFDSITVDDILYLGLRNKGLDLSGSTYVKLKGLTVRNVKQYASENTGVGFNLGGGTIYLENCTAHDIWGTGFVMNHGNGSTGVYYLTNCDSYNCCDWASVQPGNAGNGYSVKGYYQEGQTYFTNCRAWNNSDQGFNTATQTYVKTVGCWSFDNKGWTGQGWKMGWVDNVEGCLTTLGKEFHNNIAAYNNRGGFLTNEWYGDCIPVTNMYNNLSYKNGSQVGDAGYNISYLSTGSNPTIELRRVFRNNISYLDYDDVWLRNNIAQYTHSNNTWDSPVTITGADFAALPATDAAGIVLLSSARQADGSLPDLGNYFHLATGSDLINAGVDVGLSYSGIAPDINPFEYEPPDPPLTLTNIVTFSIPGQTGSTIINSTNHTVAVTMPYGTDVTNLTATWTLSESATSIPETGTARNYTNPVTIEVTAEDTITQQIWTITVEISPFSSNQFKRTIDGWAKTKYNNRAK